MDSWAPTLKKSNQLPSVRSPKHLNFPSGGKVPPAGTGWAVAALGWGDAFLAMEGAVGI